MKRILPAVGALAALLGCSHPAPKTGTAATAVLANVNGVRITQESLDLRVHAMYPEGQDADHFLKDPQFQPQRTQLLHQMAFEAAMEQIAVKQNLVNDPTTQALLAKQRATTYANVLISRAAGGTKPTEAQLQVFYDELVAARKAAGQAQGLPPFDQVKANPQFVDAWKQQQFQKAADIFTKDLVSQVPVTYADGLQTPEAEY